MPKRLISLLFPAAIVALVMSCSGREAMITGELMTWHRIAVTVDGPPLSEEGDVNPFLDYRFDVVFTDGVGTYTVPGFFAADGDAADTGATAGTTWRAYFTPSREGEWSYSATLRTGTDIAISGEPSGGEPVGTWNGAFTVTPSDKTGRDFRARGMLDYTGGRYLRFAGSGGYFIKGGADSPENFLAYTDFDGTFDMDGLNRPGEAQGGIFIHHYEPHAGDWREGDPTWGGGRGKNIIGALNYLASTGMNSVYFLTMNVAGDGKDVWPWTEPDERFRFDVSRLAQWEIVFSHMDSLGLMMHVVTQETENDQLLDGGELGRERKLYYRELIARFAHHPAVVWNLGEENTNTTEQLEAFCDWFQALDPYDHPIVVHTFPGAYDEVYGPLLGFPHIEGPSLQISPQDGVHAETIRWIDRSAEAGRAWVVCIDEIGPADTGVMPDADDPAHDAVRHLSLWGNLMAGGAGAEWYFGYQYADNDLNCEDWRSRAAMWEQTRIALDFFHTYLPFATMSHHDALTPAADDYCLAAPGAVYAVYLPVGGECRLDLGGVEGGFTVRWFNPRTGGALSEGTVARVTGGGVRSLGMPPAADGGDWVVLVRGE